MHQDSQYQCFVSNGQHRLLHKHILVLVSFSLAHILFIFVCLLKYVLLGRSKDKGKTAIEILTKMRKQRDVAGSHVDRLEANIADHQAPDYEVAEAEGKLNTAIAVLKEWNIKVCQSELSLGIAGNQSVTHLSHSVYINERMNARAIKERLRQLLRDRKFELTIVERVARRHTNAQKTGTHTQSAITHCAKNIIAILQQYNTSCAVLTKMIKSKRVPKHTVAPLPIPAECLFCLDVDDEVWQDIGLDDMHPDATLPPKWLSDINIWEGIRGMLELDRCIEEKGQL